MVKPCPKSLDMSSLRPILIHPDPRLKKVCDPVARITPDIETLAADMLATMYDAGDISTWNVVTAWPDPFSLKDSIFVRTSSMEGGIEGVLLG